MLHSVVCGKFPNTTAVCSTTSSSNVYNLMNKSASNRIKVGYIFPNWTLGGVSRGVITLAQYQPLNIEFFGIAVNSLDFYHANGYIKSGIPIWYGGESDDTCDYPGVNFVDSFKDACQHVIDNSDVIIFWGFTVKLPEFDELNWKNKPVVISSHGSCDYTKLLIDTIGKYATHYRAVSKAAGKFWDEKKNVYITYNGVDLNRILPLKDTQQFRSDLNINDGCTVAAYVGRLSGDKNPIALAQAIDKLDENYVALYVGSGNGQDLLHDKVKLILGDRAIFIGDVEHVGDAYAAADCIVMTGKSEGHCQVLNEAWAAGVPVVSTRVGAIPELEEKYGKLVEPINIDFTSDELSAAISSVTNNFEIVDRAKNMMLSNFTIAHTAIDFENFVKDVIKSHKLELM